MLQIQDQLLSLELLEEEFVCDLSKCKGACCIEGDGGAPITKEEAALVKQDIAQILPYLPEEGKASVAKYGVAHIDWDGELATPLVNKKECAYTVFAKDGTAMCGIEMAHKDGKSQLHKPFSCSLYPIRVTKYKDFEALNYHRWKICAPACELGKQLKVPVYKFLKQPLVRAYGEVWYEELEETTAALNEARGASL